MLASDQLEDVHQARTAQLERQAREDLQRRLLGELDALAAEALAAPLPSQSRRGRSRQPNGAMVAALQCGTRYVVLLEEARSHGIDLEELSANRSSRRAR